MRYKRYKKRYGGTRFIKMKFQSFMDLSTSADSMQVITISAGGPSIMRRLAPMFSAFKYYKIGNISCKLVPASTLPVDPTGLSYEAGENTVDPRDQLTPGMMRITNGEDIFEDISSISASDQVRIYNAMLLDPRWFKFMLQSGVKRHATPRYWQIGQLHQDKWPGAFVNVPIVSNVGDGTVGGTYTLANSVKDGTGHLEVGLEGSSSYGFFQTGHRGVLGWLPTDGLQPYAQKASTVVSDPFLASPPEIEVFKIILPKMHKTNYYYRCYISETVYFKEPIMTQNVADSTNHLALPLDIFHETGNPSPHLPSYGGAVWVNPFPQDDKTGGNYGND